MKREHGQHNHTVCKKLCVTADIPCNDWIVTTAFYSAIHFIDHVLFPVKHGGITYNNINEAHNFFNKKSKHFTRGYLVSLYLKKHAVDYEYLMSECWNARYISYNVNELVSNLCVRKLDNIKKDCDINKK